MWIDKNQIKVGDDYAERVQQGIKNSKCLLCLISKNYVKSENCCNELKLGKSWEKNIFLLMIENIEIKEYSIGYIAMDLKKWNLSEKTNITLCKEFQYLLTELTSTVCNENEISNYHL